MQLLCTAKYHPKTLYEGLKQTTKNLIQGSRHRPQLTPPISKIQNKNANHYTSLVTIIHGDTYDIFLGRTNGIQKWNLHH